MKRYARNNGWGLHVPRGLQERVLEVDRATSAFTASHGRSPTLGQIAEATGLSSEDVLETLEAALQSFARLPRRSRRRRPRGRHAHRYGRRRRPRL